MAGCKSSRVRSRNYRGERGSCKSAVAGKLQLTQRAAARGGEHAQIVTNVIDISISNSKVTAAAWILPGEADDTVVLLLGDGRKNAG